MNDVLQMLSTAAQHVAAAAQLVQQAHTTVQQYGSQGAAQAGQVQQGLPQQQAFGNPGGMQGAANGFGGQQGGFGGQQGGAPAQNVAQQGFSTQQAVGQQIGGQFGQAAQVTPDMIQQFIMPLVQNERVKAALTQQMQEMGISELGATQPHQLAELYQRFQNVKQQADQAGLLGNNGGGGAAPSLI